MFNSALREDADVQKVCFSMLLTGAALALLGTKASSVSVKAGSRRMATKRKDSAREAVDEATRRYLMYIIMPVWSVTGFLDWLWHRQTKIETTSGVKESVMHLLMMAEAGAPILTGLFLEMNAGALALMGAGWLAHEITVAWDVNYTISRRKIFPREQQTDGYCKPFPLTSLPPWPVSIPISLCHCWGWDPKNLTSNSVFGNLRFP